MVLCRGQPSISRADGPTISFLQGLIRGVKGAGPPQTLTLRRTGPLSERAGRPQYGLALKTKFMAFVSLPVMVTVCVCSP
jgi:hypothetical protein